jgi:hypothetical protein
MTGVNWRFVHGKPPRRKARLLRGSGTGEKVAKRIALDLLVVSAVTGQPAFEQDEGIDLEWLRREAAVAFEEGSSFPRPAAFPAGEGDVRVKGAALGLEAGRLAGALDPGGECGDRLPRLDPGP